MTLYTKIKRSNPSLPQVFLSLTVAYKNKTIQYNTKILIKKWIQRSEGSQLKKLVPFFSSINGFRTLKVTFHHDKNGSIFVRKIIKRQRRHQ